MHTENTVLAELMDLRRFAEDYEIAVGRPILAELNRRIARILQENISK